MSDIIDRIDELVDEQMAGGEPRQGYEFGDPTYPKCPHCGRHWHGLKITQRIGDMYTWGRFDPEYSVAEDDSPVLCEGSDFIGPQRPTGRSYGRREINWSVNPGNLYITILPDVSGMQQALAEMQRRITEMMFGSGVVEAMEDFGRSITRASREFESFLCFDSRYEQPPEPVDCPDVSVEFGPQNWVHEFRRIPNHSSWSYLITPNTRAVASLWDKFTAPDYPVPERPGLDFDAIEVRGAVRNTGPELPPLGRS